MKENISSLTPFLTKELELINTASGCKGNMTCSQSPKESQCVLPISTRNCCFA